MAPFAVRASSSSRSLDSLRYAGVLTVGLNANRMGRSSSCHDRRSAPPRLHARDPQGLLHACRHLAQQQRHLAELPRVVRARLFERQCSSRLGGHRPDSRHVHQLSGYVARGCPKPSASWWRSGLIRGRSWSLAVDQRERCSNTRCRTSRRRPSEARTRSSSRGSSTLTARTSASRTRPTFIA